ncbi:uncharacterized protein LOC143039314 [Oratosquilla oratoria]|uniref:uncharacterized protein LOC143039314 n=1 Tax=Oratosquilla oratoria TaxID=337810 RepID=UPI003F77034A
MYIRTSIDTVLQDITATHLAKVKRRIGRKLSALYGGPLELPSSFDHFLNLSSITLTEKQREFLNLGLNCHYMSKEKPLNKRIELEILLDDIQHLENEKKVTTSPDLQAEIIREANITRGHSRSSLLTPELRAAALELKNNDQIVIRRADKSSTFVILNKEDYLSKMASILNDTTKFKRISRNPTNDIKTKLNRLIRENNNSSTTKLPLIEGDHKLGYAYGNVKTHKNGHPLRPIISQTPSVTYKLAKRLNALISPFVPAYFSLKSSEEFLDILKTARSSNIMASTDVESLFTNVGIDDTIDFICQRLYHPEQKIAIPEKTLRLLLQACTKEVPFYGPDGNMNCDTFTTFTAKLFVHPLRCIAECRTFRTQAYGPRTLGLSGHLASVNIWSDGYSSRRTFGPKTFGLEDIWTLDVSAPGVWSMEVWSRHLA